MRQKHLVVPFIVIHGTYRALRVSNAVAVVMLFLAGCSLGRYAGHRPLRKGFAMVALGIVLVLLTLALGG
jgi:VIT1/CCC1 family predicted Fe2+/Mn2+ transporter